jgi:FAD/FMN-containing dehydrogenase
LIASPRHDAAHPKELPEVTASISSPTGVSTDLGRLLDGAVLGPGDPGFDQARAAWNVAVDQRVTAVVLAEDAADLAATVRYARRRGLAVATQPRGHGASAEVNDTILVRTGRLGGIEVDPARRIARVEAGVRWARLQPETARHGLTGLAGSSADPSVTGFVLGGGLSWFSRKHGFAANSVRAFEVLDADGVPARVTAGSDPELFWGLRGGGGDYALVTALELELFPAAELYGGQIMWPVERAAEVLGAYRRVVAAAPEELTVWFTLLNLPPVPELPPFLSGRSVVSVQATCLGAVAEGQALLRPLSSIGGALVDALRPVPASELDAVAAEPAEPMPSALYSLLLRELDDEAFLRTAVGSPWASLQIRHLGGALRRDPAAGAVGSVDEEFLVSAIGVPALPPHQVALAEAMEPYAGPRKLFNFLDGEPASTAFSPETVGRLRALKAARDPYGVFRSNRPINR